jgi:hypothetical protein
VLTISGQSDDAGGHQNDTDGVEPFRRAVALGEQLGAECRGEQPDRDVEPEDPVPVEPLGDHAADERTGRHGQPGQAAVDTDDQPPPLRGERGGEDRQAQRQDDGRAQALNRACHDQIGRVGSEGACCRGHREQQQAEIEDPPPPEPITEGCGGDDPGGKRDAVGIDRPLQGREVGVQVALHPRQRGDHDQRVEHHHEVRGRRKAQYPAQLRRGGRGRGVGHRLLQQVPPRRAGLELWTNGRALDGHRRATSFLVGAVRLRRCGSSDTRTGTDP